MDGLECSEMRFRAVFTANSYFRLEAEYFNSPQILFKNTISGSKAIHKIQYGTSKFLNENHQGSPVLRLNEFDGPFIKTPEKYCDLLSSDDFESLKLHQGDVLVCRTNGNPNLVGKAAVIMEDYPYAFASYLFRIVVNSSISPETLVAYLNGKYGRSEINRNSMKGNQTNFSPAKFKDIKIPVFDKSLQIKIKTLTIVAYNHLKEAKCTYSDAELLLLTALKMDRFAPSGQVVAVKNLSKSFIGTGRLDAEYYQPKYDSYKNALKTTDTVSSLCRINDNNYQPSDDLEYKYIELSNVGVLGNISDVKSIIGKELPSRARRQVKSGQVIIASVEGSLQSCALITDEYNNALCSTGFYVLDSDSISPETLLILFKSEPIQALLKQRCSGTILTAINKEELLNMPLPQIDNDIQKQISKKVQQSFALRRQSEQLFEYAKEAVEIAIEQGEERAMEWLKEKGVES